MAAEAMAEMLNDSKGSMDNGQDGLTGLSEPAAAQQGDNMKTWMTNKHFSTLFSAFRGRSVNLNLQNTGLSDIAGLEQLGKHLNDGGCLRWVMLCFSPLLSPITMHIPTTHTAITALDVSGCGSHSVRVRLIDESHTSLGPRPR